MWQWGSAKFSGLACKLLFIIMHHYRMEKWVQNNDENKTGKIKENQSLDVENILCET